jgi:hypothetical protein
MSRQDAGLVLAGLASFCVVIGLFLSGALAGRAAVIPRGENQVVEVLTMTATGASYFSPTRLVMVTGANIEQTETITGVARPSSSSVAVWNVVTTTSDTTRHQQLEPMVRTLAIDRATAQLVTCCNANINGNALIRQYGVAGYVFPPGTRKQAYDVFDAILGRPVPVAYSGQATVGGIRVYQFTEDVTAAPIGFSPYSLSDPELYSVHRVYWVDPETGALLNVSVSEDLYLAETTTRPVTHLLEADLTATQDTVAGLAGRDAQVRGDLAAAGTTRVVSLSLAGGFALIGGWLLARKGAANAKTGGSGDASGADGSGRGGSGADAFGPDGYQAGDYEPDGYRAWRLQASRLEASRGGSS